MQDLVIKVSGQYISPIALGVKHSGEYVTADTLFIKDNNVWNAFKTYLIPDNAIFWVDDAGYGSDALLCDGTSGTTDCINAFMFGAASPSAKTGSDTHITGSIAATTNSVAGNVNTKGGSVWHGSDGHTHAIAAHTHPSADHKPPFYSLMPVVLASNKLKVAFRPIILYRFNTIPYGWEHVSAADGRYIRNETTAGATGGSATHSHGSTTISTAQEPSTNQIGEFETGGGHRNRHTHTANHATGSADNNPSHAVLRLLKATKNTNACPRGAVLFFTSSISNSAWSVCDGTSGSPDYISAMIKIGTTVDEVLSGSNLHSDISEATATGSTNPHNAVDRGTSTQERSNTNHAHTITAHTHGTTNPSLPVHVSLIPGWKTK